jgi:hypothetical protein
MHLALALMTILLLHRIGSKYQNLADKHRASSVELARNLGQRALRSGHLEVLIFIGLVE